MYKRDDVCIKEMYNISHLPPPLAGWGYPPACFAGSDYITAIYAI